MMKRHFIEKNNNKLYLFLFQNCLILKWDENPSQKNKIKDKFYYYMKT